MTLADERILADLIGGHSNFFQNRRIADDVFGDQNMFDVNKLQVAKPCNVGWENMSGDERKRFCSECKLHVYNFAGMTKPEVSALIADANGGRLCVRLFKRADGTVLTKDCPVGFRAYQKRIVKFAGAAFATVLGLFTFSPAQTNSDTKTQPSTATTKTVSDASLSGMVTDPHGSRIPGLKVFLFLEGKKKPVSKTETNSTGLWNFKDLKPGNYTVQFSDNKDIFKKTIVKDLVISNEPSKEINVIVEPSELTVVVGIFAEAPMIDTTSSGTTFTIDSKRIRSLPF